MAELTKAEKGMGGVETVDMLNNNFHELNEETPGIARYTPTMADVPSASRSKVSAVDNAKFSRYGSIVTFYAHFNATVASGATPVLIIPNGFKPQSGGAQMPVTIEQSGGDDNKFAYTAGAPVQLYVHGINGNLYVSGTWFTEDSFPA